MSSSTSSAANVSLEVVQLPSDHRLSVHIGDLMRQLRTYPPGRARRMYVAGRPRTTFVVSDRARIPVAVMDRYLEASARGEI